jgi:mRNA interferase RelE/StbE
VRYTVVFAVTARKELEKLRDPLLKRISRKIDELEQDPRPPGCLKMRGTEGDMWRVRVGDYRILYTIEDVLASWTSGRSGIAVTFTSADP